MPVITRSQARKQQQQQEKYTLSGWFVETLLYMQQQFINYVQQFINNLRPTCPTPIQISMYAQLSKFSNACARGHLKRAQQLFREELFTVDVLDEAFIRACCYDHLHVAQWLLSIKPDINISVHNAGAFRFACQNGDLHIAQWLLSVKPDINISARDEEAFRWACSEGHLQVAQWLQTLKPHLYVINDYDDYYDYDYDYYDDNSYEELPHMLQDIYTVLIKKST